MSEIGVRLTRTRVDSSNLGISTVVGQESWCKLAGLFGGGIGLGCYQCLRHRAYEYVGEDGDYVSTLARNMSRPGIFLARDRNRENLHHIYGSTDS